MTEPTIERGTFVDRVNAESEKAREAINRLQKLAEDDLGPPEGEGGWLSIVVLTSELVEAEHHLENARLRILDFARQEADA